MATCSLSFPPQINLAKLPTPLQPLRRLSEKYDVELYVKRDDLSGIALSGNKIRKLEFVLADALARKVDTVITLRRRPVKPLPRHGHCGRHAGPILPAASAYPGPIESAGAGRQRYAGSYGGG